VPARLVSLDGNADTPLDRAVLLVGRHLRCDARIDALRVTRLHCCLAWHHGELNVRDLGSTNVTRINGGPAEAGRLRAGDELSIAHLRYRLDADQGPEVTPISPSAGEQDIDPPALSRGRMT
jgi:pSer/pThr/pTyr-binding forkhead associated (FHA) protein